jgi:hypothetical protein
MARPGHAAQLGAAAGGDVRQRVLVEETEQRLRHQRGGDRVDTPGQALAGDQEVRRRVLLLVEPERAGAAEPGLHLVENEQDAVLVAQPPYAGEVARRRDGHAESRRNRLEEDGGGRLAL